jgi:F-type H+-transporting ATPase subunit delta
MGSATREALASSRTALAASGSTADLATGESLFEAARVVGDSPQLLAALADPAADAVAKAALVSSVFANSVTPGALQLLQAVAAARWSTPDDLLAGIEDLGLRTAAASAPAGTSIEDELFSFGETVSSDAGLELALASKLGEADAKARLVDSLLTGKVSPQSLAIIRHLVLLPRGRRIGELVRHAASVVADEAGFAIATITSARPLSVQQLDRLKRGLASRYGRELTVNQIVVPDVVGGVRVQIGDDVIDGSVATRLNDLRLQLAG